MARGIIRPAKHGVIRGIKHNQLTFGASWTTDATSGKGVPANATEWSAVMASAGIASGGPSLKWEMQEASGNVADTIGTFTGTAGGTGLSYQNVVSGWSRKSINTTDAGSGTFVNTDAGLPDPAAASVLTLAYIKTISAAANHGLLQVSGTTIGQAEMTAAGLGRIVVGANSAPGSSDSRNVVRPWVLKHNFTGSAQALYTDHDKIVPTFASLSGKKVLAGATSVTACTAAYLYVVTFFGAAAELTDAQVKTLLQTLGWSPAWS